MVDSTAAPEPKREMKVLALGLPRTGSASIADALTILGYENVHHGIRAIDSVDDWKVINRAADATFPVLPTYSGKPFTRDEWDELYGSCEAGTDMAALFATQLIQVYPEAKVLLVVRDFDSWYKSYNSVFDELWSFRADLAIDYAEPLIGYETVTCIRDIIGRIPRASRTYDHFHPLDATETGVASRKAILGFFEAKNVNEARKNARMVYDRHYRQLQEMVPPEKLLVYRMGEGWEPICEFLDKPVPDLEFPRVNEAAALKEKMAKKIKSHITKAAMVLMPWAVGVVALGVGLWTVTRRN